MSSERRTREQKTTDERRTRERSRDRRDGRRTGGAGDAPTEVTQNLIQALKDLAKHHPLNWEARQHETHPEWTEVVRSSRAGADVYDKRVIKEVLNLSRQSDNDHYDGTNPQRCPCICALKEALGLTDADIHPTGELLKALECVRAARWGTDMWTSGEFNDEPLWQRVVASKGTLNHPDVLSEILGISGEFYNGVDIEWCPRLKVIAAALSLDRDALATSAVVANLGELKNKAKSIDWATGEQDAHDVWTELVRARDVVNKRDPRVLRAIIDISREAGDDYDGTNSDDCPVISAFMEEFDIEDKHLHPTGALLAALSALSEVIDEDTADDMYELDAFEDVRKAVAAGADVHHREVIDTIKAMSENCGERYGEQSLEECPALRRLMSFMKIGKVELDEPRAADATSTLRADAQSLTRMLTDAAVHVRTELGRGNAERCIMLLCDVFTQATLFKERCQAAGQPELLVAVDEALAPLQELHTEAQAAYLGGERRGGAGVAPDATADLVSALERVRHENEVSGGILWELNEFPEVEAIGEAKDAGANVRDPRVLALIWTIGREGRENPDEDAEDLDGCPGMSTLAEFLGLSDDVVLAARPST